VRGNYANGGTAMYEALGEALTTLSPYDLTQYTPAIILMTDGEANGRLTYDDFRKDYERRGMNVPVFCISFGNADVKELGKIADLTHARMFDGKSDLITAFRKAKGYN
jgi:Ca-activated chloride channel family protein